MGRNIEADKIILLFDNYSLRSGYLYASLKKSGYDCLAIVIQEDDFLPKDVVSVYDLLSGDWETKRKDAAKPRFFNEISVPDYWSINAGVDEPYGTVTYQHEERGRIYYTEPVRRYLVKAVDWFDRKGIVRFRDHYNRYGDICARTFYNADGEKLSKSWFSAQGKEILVENNITGDFIFDDGDMVKHFRTKTELLNYYFSKKGFAQNRIFYNSLSMPFILSNNLENSIKQDILFWQDMVGEDIPENMRLILDGKSGRTDKIVVQKRQSYDQLLELGVKREKLHRLGFIYPFEKENNHKLEALICTDSDRIEHCQELIEMFPKMQFHIAAITVMSTELKKLDQYQNVSLYPAIKSPMREEIFKRCDYYFDINYHAEIISAVHKAFLHNQLIFAFQETVHNREYVADVQIYPVSAFDRMVNDVRNTMENQTVMEERLEIQRKHALTEDKEAYVKIMEI